LLADRTLNGVVLRYANFSESSRMLTIFTLEEGIISAAARGCRKIKSPLRPACETFVFAAFQVHTGRSTATLTGASIVDSFYELRSDLDRLSCAVQLRDVVLTVVPEQQPQRALFSLFVRSLGSLCHDGEDPFKVALHFESHAMALSGYAPQLGECALCGGALGAKPGFSPSDGGALCTTCAQAAGLPSVSLGALTTLRHVMEFDVDRLHVLSLTQSQKDQAAVLWRDYMAYHLDRHFKAPEFIQRVDRFKLSNNSLQDGKNMDYSDGV
jgi:DNA repair protein RecO (recombination protein O)